MTQHKTTIIEIMPLFLVLFIDGMGLGLLFPILNALIISPNSSFIAQSTSEATRNIYFGATISIFMICWFFGAAVLGDLSDTIGRKKSLLICLIGTFIGYALSAISVGLGSFTLMIIGRVIAGFTSGSQPIAQAAIVDVSTEETLPRNMGWILLAVSLGFVLGPTLGGILSNKALVGWFDFSTPLYFAAVVALINAALLWFTFHETFEITGKIKLRLHHAIMIFVSAFQHVKIRHLALVFLVMITGWSMYFATILMYMDKIYHISNFQTSLYMGCLGIGFSIGCGYLVNKLSALFTLRTVAISGFLLCALAPMLTVLIHIQWVAWLAVIFAGATIGYSYSAILVMFSNLVDDHEQGWVMGVTGSILALCFGITSFLGAILVNYGPHIPMWFTAICLIASGLMLFGIKPTKASQ